jgi:hypothetical protein
MSSDYEVTLMTEADIPGAIDAIQQAFADDPYSKWIYNDRSKVGFFPRFKSFLAVSNL